MDSNPWAAGPSQPLCLDSTLYIGRDDTWVSSVACPSNQREPRSHNAGLLLSRLPRLHQRCDLATQLGTDLAAALTGWSTTASINPRGTPDAFPRQPTPRNAGR